MRAFRSLRSVPSRHFATFAILLIALGAGPLTQAQTDPEGQPQSQPQPAPQQPPVAVNPKPCEVTVSPNGPTSNTCAQQQQPAGTPPESTNGGPPVPETGATVQNQQESPQPQLANRITKAEAKELFRSVDDILRFVSQDTGLPIKHKVKRKLISRESMENYVHKHMREDKDSQRLEHEELVLQKFGLIPRGYNLHVEFLRLLGEQVAAYYEPKNKTVNLLDWVQPEIQKPVLAHELTHALQDQMVDLQTWPDAGDKDDKPLPDQQEQAVEEAQAARQCVTEGQAMITLYDYSLAPLGKSVVTAPDMVNAMRAGVGDNSDSPVFAAAPMFLKESLMMPYSFGTDFVRTVLVNKGKEAAFAGMLKDPPVDTRQVMQPETYLMHQVVEPLTIPDLDRLVAPNYERYDFGEMGEFDVYLLAKQYGGEETPQNYYPHWHGGYYFAGHAKTAARDNVSLLYFSRWDSPEAAQAFAKLYSDYLPKRYKRATENRSASAVTEGGAPFRVWDTEQGMVRIEVQGNDLLIMEDFDDLTAERAREVLFFHMTMPAQETKHASPK